MKKFLAGLVVGTVLSLVVPAQAGWNEHSFAATDTHLLERGVVALEKIANNTADIVRKMK